MKSLVIVNGRKNVAKEETGEDEDGPELTETDGVEEMAGYRVLDTLKG